MGDIDKGENDYVLVGLILTLLQMCKLFIVGDVQSFGWDENGLDCDVMCLLKEWNYMQ